MTEPLELTQTGSPVVPGEEAELDFTRLEELIQQLVKSVRAHQIYDVQNPVYQRFINNLVASFEALWQRTQSVSFEIHDDGMKWEGRQIDLGDSRDNLGFLFYKDGIRGITFDAGFETEVEQFLNVMHHAKHLSRDSEDLITLLWDADFSYFRYDFVDQLAQGVEIPEANDGLINAVPMEVFEVDLASMEQQEPAAGEEQTRASAAAAAAPPSPMDGIVRMDDFQETLYFLDDNELRVLRREVELEMARDLKGDVIRALFDRLEDGNEDRQREILEILGQLLPSLLIRGDMRSASMILVELDRALEGDALKPSLHERARGIFEELSRSESVEQLVRALEDGVLQPEAQELGVFFMHLRPSALPMLLSAARRSAREDLRQRFEAGADAIARAHAADAVALLDASDPEVAAGAASQVARLKVEDAAAGLARLAVRPEPIVRLAAVEAALALHTGATMATAITALEDDDREVRMTAARGLATYRYAPARARLEHALKGSALRDADRTERVLFFETYALVGGGDAVPYLDSVLNGRSRLGRRTDPELRACAARALALIKSAAARDSLKQSEHDKDVVVRNEVSRALRQAPSR